MNRTKSLADAIPAVTVLATQTDLSGQGRATVASPPLPASYLQQVHSPAQQWAVSFSRMRLVHPTLDEAMAATAWAAWSAGLTRLSFAYPDAKMSDEHWRERQRLYLETLVPRWQ